MAKYHITANGDPGLCHARTRPCPLGDASEHFPSPEAARASFEEKQGTLFSPTPRIVSSDELMWSKETGSFVGDISELGSIPKHMRSSKTGKVVELKQVEEKRDADNDVLYWRLRPTDGTERWEVTVFND